MQEKSSFLKRIYKKRTHLKMILLLIRKLKLSLFVYFLLYIFRPFIGISVNIINIFCATLTCIFLILSLRNLQKRTFVSHFTQKTLLWKAHVSQHRMGREVVICKIIYFIDCFLYNVNNIGVRLRQISWRIIYYQKWCKETLSLDWWN